MTFFGIYNLKEKAAISKRKNILELDFIQHKLIEL